jgi:flagellar hook-associated protein 2
MGQIQTGVGLASGFPIASTVSDLMQVAEIPYNNLTSQTNALKQREVDVNELASLLLAAQSDTDNLGKTTTFNSPAAASSDSSILSATVTGTPALGNYQFTPLQVAQQAQYLSSGFQSTSTAVGAGTLTLRFGGNLQQGLSLADINGGQGFTRGSIRITDCSGASAEINLSNATSLDDVVNDINSNTAINVTASIAGDQLQLTDNTGQTASSLMVQDVGGGTTAESLGLVGAGVQTTSNQKGTVDQIEGQSIVKLSSSLQLSALNDGNGVQTNGGVADIHYTLANGDNGYIDLSPITSTSGTSQVDEATTLGDILAQINAADPNNLQAQIAPDGTSLEVKDLTSGSGTFTLTPAYNSPALQNLGLTGAASNGVIQGTRIIGGLNSVLLSSLNGGQGLGTLGTLNLTARNGKTASADLSSCETVQDVINAINKSGIGITAAVNAAGDGIQLTDTTGGTKSNLIVASGDSTAQELGIATNAAVTSVDSGDLHLQIVGAGTLLSSLNGGAGVAAGNVTITDSTGKQVTFDVTSDMQTVGDVIQAINQLDSNVQAQINSTGDGIELVDMGGGSGQLQVAEDGSTTAADLHLLGTGQQVSGTTTQTINGTTTNSVTLAAGDTLSDLVSKINALNAGVTASIFNDGSNLPDRLELTSNQSGAAGQFVVDASGLNLSLSATAEGTNAVLAVGSSQGNSSPTLISSPTNSFTSAVNGLTLDVQQASTSPVTVSVTNSSTNALASLQAFISDYNNLVTHMTSFTQYDAATNTKSDLTDDPTTMELQQQTAKLVSGQISTSGSVQSLADLGVTINNDGTLSLDQSTFTNAYQSDPDGVEQFFTAANTGFSALFHNLSQQFAATGTGILSEESTALSTEVTDNQRQLTLMQTSLNNESAQLTNEFDNMEVAISKLQSELSIINAFAESVNGSSSGSSSSSSSSATPYNFSNIGSSGTSSSGSSSSTPTSSSSTSGSSSATSS